MILPVKLEIPDKYVEDFLNDKLDISKAIIRNSENGEIVKHINLIKNVDEPTNVFNKKIYIGIGIAAVFIIVGGIITIRIKKNKKKSVVELPDYVIDFKKKFNSYLKEAADGSLNTETINELLAILNENEKNSENVIAIDFSSEEMKMLLTQIYEYTIKLSKMENISPDNTCSPTSDSLINLVNLRKYLYLQKKIIEAS